MTRYSNTHLLRDNLGDLRIAVTKRVDSDTSSEVQVAAILHIPQVATLSLHHHGSRANIGWHHKRSSLIDKLDGERVGSRVGVRNRGIFLFAC